MNLVQLGLFSLQHRGEKKAGIVAFDGERMDVRKGSGLVRDVFFNDKGPAGPVKAAIGYVGSDDDVGGSNTLPLLSLSHHGAIAVAHDGHVTNKDVLRRRLLDAGALIQTSNESELMAHLIAERRDGTLADIVLDALTQIQGAYAGAIMADNCLMAFRDPLGIRPLVIGRLGNRWLVASESCVFNAIGAELVRDVRPGELCIIDDAGLRSRHFAPGVSKALCTFEYIYFARADSVIDGRSVHEVRKTFGRLVAQEAGIDGDLVVPAPDSALSAAVGYSEASGIPFDIGIIKNRYVGRTFSEPSTPVREANVHLKLNPIASIIRGKRIILVDDSIVRGTTSGRTIQMLRLAGAKEVHMVVASPPFSHPCQFGIHVQRIGELIAANRSTDQICRIIGADSLSYLSHRAMHEALEMDEADVCSTCVGGSSAATYGTNDSGRRYGNDDH